MTPRVFISYSHDSDDHKGWVARLAADLRTRGIDAVLDQWDLALGADVVSFMEAGVTTSDRVLLICTPRYTEKANGGDGGVGYERLIVSAELVSRIDTTKFVPIVRGRSGGKLTPTYLGERRYIDFTSDEEYAARLEELGRELHGMGPTGRPPLGPNPYAATTPPQTESPRMAGESGLTADGRHILTDPWFENQATTAATGLQKSGRPGAMEVRAALHSPLRKSQLELLNAVRASEIHTFGWPLAVTLENREEYRPRPVADGIQAEIAVSGKGLVGVTSYDYWAVRTSGDFYALQSYFEDERTPSSVFFNTRIVRVAEALMFSANLFDNLGAVTEAMATIRIAHSGLAGRTLRSSNANRQIVERTTIAGSADALVTDSLAGLRARLVDHVMQITEPLFLLFDFAQFQRAIYEDIVTKYQKGQVT